MLSEKIDHRTDDTHHVKSTVASHRPPRDPDQEWDGLKQERFVTYGTLKDPITKEYTDIAGVNPRAGVLLEELGFKYAYQLIGHYMVNSLDDAATNHWLEHKVGVRHPGVRQTIVNTLRKWCEALLL